MSAFTISGTASPARPSARGVPVSIVARMLGHAGPKMTLRYAHVGARDLQAAAERIGAKIEAAMETGVSPAEALS